MTFVNEIYALIDSFGFFELGEPMVAVAGHFMVAFLSTTVVLVPLAIAWIIIKWIVRLGRYDN